MPMIGGVGGTTIWTAYAATNVDQDFTQQAWMSADNVQTVSVIPADIVTVQITIAFKSNVNSTIAAVFKPFIADSLGIPKLLGAHATYPNALSLQFRKVSTVTNMWSCGFQVYVGPTGSTITVLDSEIIVVRYR